jgi:hypothetical protein
MRAAALLAYALLASASLCGLSLPQGWDFGTTSDEKPVTGSLIIANDERDTLRIQLLSPCDCLELKPGSFRLAPGGSATIFLAFDPAGYSGKVQMQAIVRIRKPGAGAASEDIKLLAVRGIVLAGTSPLASPPGGEEPSGEAPVVVRYYYSPDCKSCADFLEAEVPRVEKLLGGKIVVVRMDIRNPAALAELDRVLADNGTFLRAIPVLVVDGTFLQGEKEIRQRFEATMTAHGKRTGG